MASQSSQSLPISAERKTIIETIQRYQVVVIEGDTGSGKTTQLPQICLEAFASNTRVIGCTQPRRIAAISVAARVAEELGDLGRLVGYKIRFQDKTTTATRIKFMTDGVLLAETRNDPLLRQYGVIIVDEAHERSLNIDFILGYLKKILDKRPDLKIIITSATIDTKAFSRHFADAPIISIAGRTYPVTVRYRPQESDESPEETNLLDHCLTTVQELLTNRPEGDILLFLPTERDIREYAKMLEDVQPGLEVLQLYGRMAAADQHKIFRQGKKIKLIVATNIAETSLTVPGIRYVIDSGLARISSYNVRSKTTSLPVCKISQASCEQRKGRCGRVGPGLCIRLYSEDDFTSRETFTRPEITRSNLAEVILQMLSLRLGDPLEFPFIDPPSTKTIREGYRLLAELGAITGKKKLTKRGRIMADLPIDPCISRILIEASARNCLREIQIISAALAIQDPRIRPADKQQLNRADTAHKAFDHPFSDFLTYLNLWQSFHEELQGGRRSWSQLKKFCTRHYLSFQRMREWFDLHDQLKRILGQRKAFCENKEPASYAQIHLSLLTGFLRNLGQKVQGKNYLGTHNKQLMIFPGSGQFAKSPEWIVAGSLMYTNRFYAINAASISVEWIEEAGKAFCRYSWTNPRWRKKTGTVIAEETVSLFGLTLIGGRLVNFPKRAAKNREIARDIFIHAALIEGQLSKRYTFLDTNKRRIDRWRQMEEKLRTRDIVVDDAGLFAFYDRVLPDSVYDQTSLERYLKNKAAGRSLLVEDKDILLRTPDDCELLHYPKSIQVSGKEIGVDYHFTPGNEADGITFRVPIGSASTLKTERFEWLVPGLFPEKLGFLLRSLPKNVRKRLVPLSDATDKILDDLDYGRGPLLPNLEQSIHKLFGFAVGRSDWKKELPQHLTPKFALVDPRGRVCLRGNNIQELLTESPKTPEQKQQQKIDPFSEKIHPLAGKEYSEWDFKKLPGEIILRDNNGNVTQILHVFLHPLPEKAVVKIGFTTDYHMAQATTQKGLLMLYRLQFSEGYKAFKRRCKTSLTGPTMLQLAALAPSQKALIELFTDYVLNRMFAGSQTGIPGQEEFLEMVRKIQDQGFYTVAQGILEATIQQLRKRREALERIQKIFLTSKQKGHTLPQVQDHFYGALDFVFPLSFLQDKIYLDPVELDRQMRGLRIRLERFYVDPLKDQQKQEQLNPYINAYEEILARKEELPDEAKKQLTIFKEMIDEYRLRLFSPEIRSRTPVSPKKLDKQKALLRKLY